jgi:hypothetical protein
MPNWRPGRSTRVVPNTEVRARLGMLSGKAFTVVAGLSFVWLNTYRDINVIRKMVSLCVICLTLLLVRRGN